MPELTTTEAAALLGLSKATLRRLADAGDLTHHKTDGGHRRFAEADLLAYRSLTLRLAPGAEARAAVWAAAALAVLREAEMRLGSASPLCLPFKRAADELRRLERPT